jgi:hypothetical protein
LLATSHGGSMNRIRDIKRQLEMTSEAIEVLGVVDTAA